MKDKICVALILLLAIGILYGCRQTEAEQTKPVSTNKPVVITTSNTYTGKVTVYAENDMVFDYLGEMEITGLPGKRVEIVIHTEVEHEQGTQ